MDNVTNNVWVSVDESGSVGGPEGVICRIGTKVCYVQRGHARVIGNSIMFFWKLGVGSESVLWGLKVFWVGLSSSSDF